MHLTDLLGLLAGTMTTIAFVPQVLHTPLTGSARNFTAIMLVFFVTGVSLWLVYGLMAGLAAVAIANAATLPLTLPIPWIKPSRG